MKNIESIVYYHKGFDIINSTFASYLEEFGSDETTSPNGVEPRRHIREKDGKFQVWSWGVNGNHPYFIEEFDLEKEASLSLYKSMEFYIQEKNWDAPSFFDTKSEAIADLANSIDRNVDVIERYLRILDYRKNQNRIFQEKLEAEKQVVKLKSIADAEFIKPLIDAIFKDDCRRAKTMNNNDKTRELSIAFKNLLTRIDYTLTGDFWKVYNLIK